MNRKPIVGLAGGVGSGKSTVAELLHRLGAAVIDSDRLGHEAINLPDVKQTLVGWWGRDVLAPDDSVDRSAVARRVFDDPEQRTRLEALLHPRIAERRARLVELHQADPKVRMIVIDSPLLYETGLDRLCDRVIFVDSTEEHRRQRSEKSRDWKGDEVLRREKSQWPLDKKRSRADHVCSNKSDFNALCDQVRQLFDAIAAEQGMF